MITITLKPEDRARVHPDTVFVRQLDPANAWTVFTAERRLPNGRLISVRKTISETVRESLTAPERRSLLVDTCIALDNRLTRKASEMFPDPDMQHHIAAHRELLKQAAGVHPVSHGRSSILHPSQQAISQALRESYINPLREAMNRPVFANFINPNQEEDNMSDFNQYTIYLTSSQEEAVRRGTMPKAEALALIAEVLPLEVVLTPGLRYEYDGSQHQYEVVRVEGSTVLLRRLVGNSAGDKGSVFPETVSKVTNDLRSGRAVAL